jgi:hypothetical protein
VQGLHCSVKKTGRKDFSFFFLISFSFFSFTVILLSTEINTLGYVPLEPEFILVKEENEGRIRQDRPEAETAAVTPIMRLHIYK